MKDVRPGPETSFPFGTKFTAFAGELFFIADDGAHGRELWKSDGTAAGTTRVTDINPEAGARSTVPLDFTNYAGALFFEAIDPTHGAELWKSDGTAAGTTLVKDINPTGHSFPSDLTDLRRQALLRSLGRDARRRALEVRRHGGGDEDGRGHLPRDGQARDPHELTKAGGELFFAAFDVAHGDELFKSDGTAAGTTLVKDINPGANSDSYLTELTGVGDTLFFTATVKFDDHGFPVDFQLWKSNGIAAGTKLVKPGGAVDPRYLTGVGGRLFYAAKGARRPRAPELRRHRGGDADG